MGLNKDFSETFDIPAGVVIEQMDAAGDDIPSQNPQFSLPIRGVGLTRENIPISIRSPFESDTFQQVACSVKLAIHLPATKRGIHISRLNHAIAEQSQKRFDNLQQCVENLTKTVSEITYGAPAHVSLSGKLAYWEAVPGWKAAKDKLSLEHIGLHCEGYLEGGKFIQQAGFSFNHITACPCVQQTMKHLLLTKKVNIEPFTQIPFLTHSQRCETKVSIQHIPEALPLSTLIRAVDKVIFRVRNTLPRENELLLVFQAHQKPQFIEDVVRQIPLSLYEVVQNYPHSTVKTTCRSMESIHDFDIHAESEYTVAQLKTV